MADEPRKIEIEDDDDDEQAEDSGYLLDLDADSDADVDALTREALEAVERRKEERASGGVERVGARDRSERAGRGEAELDEEGEEPLVERLQSEIAELRDRSIRTLADFENYRKRAERERDELKRFALLDLVRELLPVVDNLERAMAASGSLEDLKTGVDMTLRQFMDLLRHKGLELVIAEGAPFDPNVHEAVMRVEDPSVDRPTVVEEMQRGYTLAGRLLRPSLVRVAVPPRDRREGS